MGVYPPLSHRYAAVLFLTQFFTERDARFIRYFIGGATSIERIRE